MAFLFKRQEDDAELGRSSRRLLRSVRDGMSELEAAAEAGVSQEEIRAWRREPAFRDALRRAKDAGPCEPVIDLNVVYKEMVAEGEGPGTESWNAEVGDPIRELREAALGEASDR